MADVLSLPGEVRNMIYKHLFVLDEHINPMSSRQGSPLGFFGLLCASKTTYRECASILYSQNCFDVYDNDVQRFLNQIGRDNVQNIVHLRLSVPLVTFPKITYPPGEMGDGLNFNGPLTLKDVSVRVLSKIQRDCPQVKSLTLRCVRTWAIDDHLEALEEWHPGIHTKELLFINQRLRAFPNLQEIIVELEKTYPYSTTRNTMESVGWTIKMVEGSSSHERINELPWDGGKDYLRDFWR